MSTRAPYPLAFHTLSGLLASRKSETTPNIECGHSVLKDYDVQSFQFQSFHSRRAGGEYGLEDWGALEGPQDGRPLLKIGGGCFWVGRLSPVPLGDCEGSLCSKWRAERPEDGTERVAGDAGMATGARVVAGEGSRSSNAKLESEGSGRGNTRKAWGSDRGGRATLWVAWIQFRRSERPLL